MKSNNQYLVETVVDTLYYKDMLNVKPIEAENVLRDEVHRYLKNKELFLLNKKQLKWIIREAIHHTHLNDNFNIESKEIDDIIKSNNDDEYIGGGR